MSSPLPFRRGAVRVALAGALTLVPLGAVAATASAEAPAADTAVVHSVAGELTDIAAPHDRGQDRPTPHDRPDGPDQRGRHDLFPWPSAPEHFPLPATGSAG